MLLSKADCRMISFQKSRGRQGQTPGGLKNQKPYDVQRDFLKFTAQKIKADLVKNHPDVLERFKVKAKDRQYQFWERNPLTVEIWSEKVLMQKLKYIHENPVRAGLCSWATEYKYSSALLY